MINLENFITSPPDLINYLKNNEKDDSFNLNNSNFCEENFNLYDNSDDFENAINIQVFNL